MERVNILDCTLRDGGYINDWLFGKQCIGGIIKNLVEAQINIIECGFLRPVTHDENSSVFSSVEQIAEIIKPKNTNIMYVAMVEHHNYQKGLVTSRRDDSIDGIRLTFRKNEWNDAKEVAKELMDLGYKVFVQPVGTCTYSDDELMALIKGVNELKPFAFYLVDTLGMLYQHDMRRFFYLIDNNLAKDIFIGFHSHNNLQLSFSNAQEMIRLSHHRNLIIDTSVYGMGRGVGNLATELLADYINNNIEQRYSLVPVLNIADKYLMPIYAQQRWGYDLPYFISASVKCHPNYASYLIKKQTLDIETIEKLLSLIPMKDRDEYNEKLIESLYSNLQDCIYDDESSWKYAESLFKNRNVLVLCPGSSVESYSSKINDLITSENAIVITVNFVTSQFKTDILFISNEKRLLTIEQLPKGLFGTSNLKERLPKSATIFNYASLLGEGNAADNSSAMLIRLLKATGAKRVYLAGIDGFDVNVSNNYFVDNYKREIDFETAKKKNDEIGKQLRAALQGMNYEVITPTKYDL